MADDEGGDATGSVLFAGAAGAGRPAGSRLSVIVRAVLVSEYFILYLTIAGFLALAVFVPDLITARNLANQLSNVWPLLTVAIGQTLVIIVTGIDLSQGAIMGFASVIGAALIAGSADPNLLGTSPLWGLVLDESGGILAGSQWATAAALAAMLTVGMAIGLFNGYFVAVHRMPAFMVTLVSLMLFSSAAIWLTQSQNIVNLPAEFTNLGAGDVVSVYFGEKLEATIKRRDLLPFVTYPMMIAVALAVVAHVVLRFTVFGRYVYAVGTNAKTAEISGVPVQRVVVMVFVFSGFCAAVAAIIYSGRLGGGRPTIGAGGTLLDIIGATVIGGTSFAGGKGKISWTVIGVIFFVLLGNSLNYAGLSAFYVDVVKGGIILLAAALDVARTRVLARGAGG